MYSVLFLLLFGIIQLAMGNHHPLMRLSLLISIPAIYFYKARFRQKYELALLSQYLKIFLLVLVLFRGAQFVRKMAKPEVKTEDIAVVYQKSIDGLLAGKNPYRMAIDPYPFHYKGNDYYFDRPKYTPLQIFTYAPFVYAFGLKGIYVGNLLVYLLLGIFLYRYFKPTNRHYLALTLLLGGEFVFNKLFSKGVNDLLPAYLLLLSWNSIQEEKKSGSLLGLSFLAKQLPAGLFGLWFLVLRKWRNFLISVPIVLLLTIPFFITDIKAIYENLFLFNAIRPVRETSLLIYLPSALQKAVSLIGFGGAVILPLFYKSKWGLPFISLTVFILTSKMSPGNYFIWAFPFLLMWLLDDEKPLKTV